MKDAMPPVEMTWSPHLLHRRICSDQFHDSQSEGRATSSRTLHQENKVLDRIRDFECYSSSEQDCDS